MSTIEWTDATWNPIAGCSPVSEGCRNCYAAKEAIRLGGNPHPAISGKYAGTSVMRGLGKARRAVFTGVITYDEKALVKPFGWRKPRRVFVNSMSDLFHEAVPAEFIARVFGVMRLTERHTYQVLTKRPERMASFLAGCKEWEGWITHNGAPPEGYHCPEHDGPTPGIVVGDAGRWPLPNVWLGTSVEDQAAADERIPHLLATPAAVRFLSCEPLLGSVILQDGNFRNALGSGLHDPHGSVPYIHWVIVGGESGPGARGFNVRWARSLVEQCRGAGVPVFVKQLGARPFTVETKRVYLGTHLDLHGEEETARPLSLGDKKGGRMDEWPEEIRVREFPQVPR